MPSKHTYPCCACCATDLPHIERDTHTLPCDILAQAWDEGVAHGRNYAYYDEQPRNPYRAAHAAAHSAAQGVPAPQCGPDAARGSRGIVSVAHYGGMDA